ncbi:MAG: hypothetical protein ABWZ52_09455 [Acidimicrobiales bacterium]
MVATADPASPTRRRWPRHTAIGIVALVAIALVAIVWVNRLTFPYQGPDAPVAAGEEVNISDPGATCGPGIVSIWRPSILGQWNRTHNGGVPDPHRWWEVWEGETYDTDAVCRRDGVTPVLLPDDLEPGEIAVCDSARNCARVEIAEP